MIAFDDFLAKLQGVRRSGASYIARCPAHEDRHQSLSVGTGGDGRILLNCHAGCAFEHVVEAMGLRSSDLMPERDEGKIERSERSTIIATYDYRDEAGALLFQICRKVPKTFLVRRPDGRGGWDWTWGDARRVLYRLPQVVEAIAAGRRIFLVEGEKDVHTLEAWGLVATTNPVGGKHWKPEYTPSLAGAHVVIIPDNDKTGREHAAEVKTALDGVAASVRVVQLPGLPEKGDVTDWAKAGGTAEELKRLVRSPIIPGVVNMLDVIRGLSRFKTEPISPGVDYPWAVLNRRTRGMRPGWFCIWAGYPGSGKTTALLEITFAAAKRGQRVLLNSLEMHEEELALKLIGRWGLDTGRLYRNQLTDDDRLAFDLAASLAEYANVHLCRERTLDGMAERTVELKPDLVAVDYIGLMDMGRDNALEGTTKLSRGLKAFARTHEVPVLALSQLARPQDKSRPHVPTMFDLRASGALEGDADHIVIVFRDDSKDDAPDRDGVPLESEGRFIIAKSRHAPAGKPIPFVFDGAAGSFRIKDLVLERATEMGWSVYEGGDA